MTGTHWPPLGDGVELNNLGPGCSRVEPQQKGRAGSTMWVAELIEAPVGVSRLICAGEHGSATEARECARRQISSLKAKRDR